MTITPKLDALDPVARKWQTKPWRSPEMERCRRVTRAAIERGELRRPEACERCGARPGLTARGYSGMQAHHHDYTKPMEVQWLCAKCHREVTPFPSVMGAPVYGEKNGQSKLTADQVSRIRTSPGSGASIARSLGVSRTTINSVRRGASWATGIKS